MAGQPVLVHGTKPRIHHQAGSVDRVAFRVEQILVVPLLPLAGLMNRQIKEVLSDDGALGVQTPAQKAPGSQNRRSGLNPETICGVADAKAQRIAEAGLSFLNGVLVPSANA
jgi:hypothetical protein